MDQLIAYLSVLILFGLSIFQFLLLMGKPFGEYAWGGQQRVLSTALRVGSAVSILIYVFMGLVFLDAAEVSDIFSSRFIDDSGIWLLVAYFVLGTIMNAASRSKKERNTMTPIILVLLICSLILAI